jgi:hypothetical protein
MMRFSFIAFLLCTRDQNRSSKFYWTTGIGCGESDASGKSTAAIPPPSCEESTVLKIKSWFYDGPHGHHAVGNLHLDDAFLTAQTEVGDPELAVLLLAVALQALQSRQWFRRYLVETTGGGLSGKVPPFLVLRESGETKVQFLVSVVDDQHFRLISTEAVDFLAYTVSFAIRQMVPELKRTGTLRFPPRFSRFFSSSREKLASETVVEETNSSDFFPTPSKELQEILEKASRARD